MLAKILYLLSLLLPSLAFASGALQIYRPTSSSKITFTTLANKFGVIANAIIPFLIGLTVVIVIWGIFKYISSAGDTEKVAEGRKAVMYGIIALFLMLSFWGFVLIIRNSLFG